VPGVKDVLEDITPPAPPPPANQPAPPPPPPATNRYWIDNVVGAIGALHGVKTLTPPLILIPPEIFIC
jgi:hypothetical protein